MRLLIIALLLSLNACTGLTTVMCIDPLEGNQEAYMWIMGTERYLLIKYPDAEVGKIYKVRLTKKQLEL